MTLVAGVDSSTQSCKVVVVDAEDGRVVRSGQAKHPDGTEVDPRHWWAAMSVAVEEAGGLDDVAALSVSGQQHGMVALDADGEVVRPALLWNDNRSGVAAHDLVEELGAETWAQRTGTVPVASITVTKLRWLAQHEPENAARVAAVALPHDWLTWRLRGTGRLEDLVTDRSDASGTGYFDPASGQYLRDLVALALGRDADGITLPRVLAPSEGVETGSGLVLGPGTGDNAGAALGLGLAPGGTSISVGTSGVVCAVSTTPTHDASGLVAGFADATGNHLPLVATLNGARGLDAVARVLGVDHDGLTELVLAAPAGAGGLVHVPYLEGERTPNLPDATGSLVGMTLASWTRENLARAAVEGLWCGLADALAAVRAQGVEVVRASLVGGAARSRAVRELAPVVLGLPVDVPEPAEYVALGAARQAAWVVSGTSEPPSWQAAETTTYEAEHRPEVLGAYRAAASAYVQRVVER
ncbi:xylulose kinase [Aeromicrobium sp. Root495]|uniref:xylulokinase n=1 Tax=Aeromicrobium sp. Root495 TaxID=1736550 RepID=UPI0006F53B7F|nr:xylulokinase [Aeromicrobium sp. Root495]KQY60353.1 xylulose kinase [Aeromicrobium sp. Root495]